MNWSPNRTGQSFLLFSFQLSLFLWSELGLFLPFPFSFVFLPLISHGCSSFVCLHPEVIIGISSSARLDPWLPSPGGGVLRERSDHSRSGWRHENYHRVTLLRMSVPEDFPCAASDGFAIWRPLPSRLDEPASMGRGVKTDSPIHRMPLVLHPVSAPTSPHWSRRSRGVRLA